jgi:hypothetical protein
MPELKLKEDQTDKKACDIEQEGNCSYEDEQGCCRCVHHVNEDNLRFFTKL